MKLTQSSVTVRYVEPKDLPSLVEVEKSSFVQPWSKEDFNKCLRRNNVIGLAAEVSGVVVGFLIFEVFKKRIQLLNLAVRQRARRMGIASALVTKVVQSVKPGSKKLVAAEVRESNLPAQLFLKSVGFAAQQILHNYYPDTGEDGYQFLRFSQDLVPEISSSTLP